LGLILFREAFNLRRILNEARFNLVELRAGKGGDGAAFGRFFRAWAFLRGAVGRWRGEREKGREKGLKGAKAGRRGKKEGERSGKAGVWACFGAIFGARGGFDGVQLHDAQGWAFKWCINSV
jgi:hypothetical protein